MSKHLFGVLVTDHGVAANNRGESEGNMTTLQKLLWNGDIHTTVSAEAIRWAIRADWQSRDHLLNRTWDEAARANTWADEKFAKGGAPYIDDDVLGYMSAQAARQDGSEDATVPGQRAPRARGTTQVRRSRFEVTRAVSLSPWTGDVVFNAASVGATPSVSRRDPAPYSGEVHATRYQYGFALTPEDLYDRNRAWALVDAIIDLAQVAGNHAHAYYDFAPDAAIFRWTDDHAPRMLYAFELAVDGRLAVPTLVRRIRSGDIEPSEVIVGGSLDALPDGLELQQLGVASFPGVKAAATEVKARMAAILGV